MPIIFNGDTFGNGGTVIVNLGSGDVSLSSVKASLDGADPVEVWIRSITCTDLVNWNGWSTGGAVNLGTEAAASISSGIQCVSGVPGRDPGSVSQSISMIDGHKYWLYYGVYSMDGFTVSTPLGTRSFGNGVYQVNDIITYSGTSGSYSVSAIYSGADATSSKYGRLCNMNIVDLTASFGSGNEPTTSWCVTYLGIFNGSKTITP